MTVIDLIRQRESEFADLPALIDGPRRLTHAQLWDRVDRLSQALLSCGLRKGDVLMAWLPNCAEAIECELAALQLGALWVSINTRFTWPEVEEIIRDCGPRLFITDAPHLSRIPSSIPSHSPSPYPSPVDPSQLILVGAAQSPGLSYESLITSALPRRPTIALSPSDLARLRYTSGTTGKAKAAILPHRVYLASLKNLQAELHPLSPSDRVLHAAPLTHASGAMMFPILAAGGANIVLPSFDVEAVLETIERERVTTMFIVPTILARLVASPSFASRDLSSLRTIMYGGAPTPVEKLAPIIERLGPALVHIFGMTEAPYPITTLRREEHRIGNTKLGSIGKPTAICEIEIRDDAGRALPDGETGELWLRGENVMDGYWRDEAETAKSLRDGWLASGDLARRDSDGYLWIVDRKKDVIISGGFNVYAKEVESVIGAHPDLAEAAVVGLPHADWGETVAAFIVARAGAAVSADALKEWCAERLSGYKRPKRIEFVSDLPKNSAGKIDKAALRASVS